MKQIQSISPNSQIHDSAVSYYLKKKKITGKEVSHRHTVQSQLTVICTHSLPTDSGVSASNLWLNREDELLIVLYDRSQSMRCRTAADVDLAVFKMTVGLRIRTVVQLRNQNLPSTWIVRAPFVFFFHLSSSIFTIKWI
jgi:hypothetical protein